MALIFHKIISDYVTFIGSNLVATHSRFRVQAICPLCPLSEGDCLGITVGTPYVVVKCTTLLTIYLPVLFFCPSVWGTSVPWSFYIARNRAASMNLYRLEYHIGVGGLFYLPCQIVLFWPRPTRLASHLFQDVGVSNGCRAWHCVVLGSCKERV
jgi:hypothetical protein